MKLEIFFVDVYLVITPTTSNLDNLQNLNDQ